MKAEKIKEVICLLNNLDNFNESQQFQRVGDCIDLLHTVLDEVLALLEQKPECERCRDTGEIECFGLKDRTQYGDFKSCPDCQKPEAGEIQKHIQVVIDQCNDNQLDNEEFFQKLNRNETLFIRNTLRSLLPLLDAKDEQIKQLEADVAELQHDLKLFEKATIKHNEENEKLRAAAKQVIMSYGDWRNDTMATVDTLFQAIDKLEQALKGEK